MKFFAGKMRLEPSPVRKSSARLTDRRGRFGRGLKIEIADELRRLQHFVNEGEILVSCVFKVHRRAPRGLAEKGPRGAKNSNIRPAASGNKRGEWSSPFERCPEINRSGPRSYPARRRTCES